jgi:uncharacterized membrane protein
VQFVASALIPPDAAATVQPPHEVRREILQLTPTIAVHMSLALSAVAIGPWVLWARMGTITRPQLHRALGYAWVTCMLGAALTGLFIRDFRLPNLWGFTPIHWLIPLTLFSLYRAFRFLAAGNIPGHRETMQWLYFGACIVAGGFTLLPGRYLGDLVWGQWLGWI